MPNHAYMVERLVEMSIQNEAHLKPYWVSPDAAAGSLTPRTYALSWYEEEAEDQQYYILHV